MSKVVYSLVLDDNVVRQVDRVAYQMNTNRSSLINRILAEYVSYQTPEMQVQDIFQALSRLMEACAPMKVLAPSSEAMLSIRSPLQFKYNPTIRYTVELGVVEDQLEGEIRASTRTQSEQLILVLNSFFLLLYKIEASYQRERNPGVPLDCTVQDGRMTRRFHLPQELTDSQDISDAIANYIQMVDQALHLYLSSSNPRGVAQQVEALYRQYLQQPNTIL